MSDPIDSLDINFAFSRLPGQPKQYVQDLLRLRHEKVARLLQDNNTYIYICGLKGVDAAMRALCQQHGMEWDALLPQLREQGRYHVETY